MKNLTTSAPSFLHLKSTLLTNSLFSILDFGTSSASSLNEQQMVRGISHIEKIFLAEYSILEVVFSKHLVSDRRAAVSSSLCSILHYSHLQK